MEIKEIETPGAGTWARDCELIGLIDYEGFQLSYHRDEDDTYWSLHCESVIAFKVTAEEFSVTGALLMLPVDGAFFEIIGSPWIAELEKGRAGILDKCKHYILEFYDEKIEIIAEKYIFTQLKEKPVYNV